MEFLKFNKQKLLEQQGDIPECMLIKIKKDKPLCDILKLKVVRLNSSLYVNDSILKGPYISAFKTIIPSRHVSKLMYLVFFLWR